MSPSSQQVAILLSSVVDAPAATPLFVDIVLVILAIILKRS
jgi:hypothetical protein